MHQNNFTFLHVYSKIEVHAFASEKEKRGGSQRTCGATLASEPRIDPDL